MDAVKDIQYENHIRRKSLVTILLVVVSTMISRVHGTSKGYVQSQVVPHHIYKVIYTVLDPLVQSVNVELLVQKSSGFFHVQAFLTHHETRIVCC